MATTQTAWMTPPATLACSASQSIQPSRLRASGDGSSSDAARSPGSSSTSPASRSNPTAVPRPITGEITLDLRTARQCDRNASACRAGGWAATAATTAALIPPTLVPQTIPTRSPRAASAGMSTDSAPAS